MSNVPPGSQPPPPSGGGSYPPPGGGMPPQGPPGGSYPPPGSPGGGSIPPPGGGSYPPPGGPQGFGAQQGFGQQGQLAEWPQRAVGYLIDFAIYFVAIVVFNILGVIAGAASDALAALVSLIAFVVYIGIALYQCKLEGETGQTIGKRATGLITLKESTGQPIGFGMAVVRRLVQTVISVFTCGLGGIVDMLFPLWDSKKQTLHDKAVSSIVLTGARKYEFGPDIFKP